MRWKFSVGLAVVVLAGCDTVHSLHPLYRPGQTVACPELAGEWRDAEGAAWRFESAQDNALRLTIRDKKEELNFAVNVVDIAGRRYIDFCEDGELGHHYAILTEAGGAISIAVANEKWLLMQVERKALTAERVRPNRHDRQTVITSSTDDLQNLFMRHALDPEVWEKPVRLERVARAEDRR